MDDFHDYKEVVHSLQNVIERQRSQITRLHNVIAAHAETHEKQLARLVEIHKELLIAKKNMVYPIERIALWTVISFNVTFILIKMFI
jgi:dihydroneopterin aldolase